MTGAASAPAGAASNVSLATAEQVLQVTASLFSEFAWNQIVPLLVLIAIFGGIVWVLVRAQGDAAFDSSQFLRDERGQLSWKLLVGAACFGVHSWGMVTLTINRLWQAHPREYLFQWALYVGIWSGSVVVLQALETWRGVRLGIRPSAPPAELGGFDPAPPPAPRDPQG